LSFGHSPKLNFSEADWPQTRNIKTDLRCPEECSQADELGVSLRCGVVCAAVQHDASLGAGGGGSPSITSYRCV